MPPIDLHTLDGDLLLRGVWEGLGRTTCHLTGGYLRDRLLGGSNTDLDLVLPGTIDATRGPARRLAARLDTSAHILGRGDKSVWRIETSAINIELWPLGRLSLDEDIRRRDFTVNALVRPLPDGEIVDRVGGLEDLAAGVLRAIARSNLEDDPVRLLRAPRFLAQLAGFDIDGRSASWIRKLAPRLGKAPRERVGQELTKMLRANRVAIGLHKTSSLGLLPRTAPPKSSCSLEWFETHLDAATRLSVAGDHPVPAALKETGDAARLALLFKAWGLPDERALAPYAWPKTDRRNAHLAVEHLDQVLATVTAPASDRNSCIHSIGTGFPAALAFAAAIEPDRPWRRWWRLWRDRGAELVHPVPLLSGEEVAERLGLKPGPQLGRAIDAMIDAQVRAVFRTRSGAERWLEKHVNQTLP